MNTDKVIKRYGSAKFLAEITAAYSKLDARLAAEADSIKASAARHGVETQDGSIAGEYLAEIAAERARLAAMCEAAKAVAA